MSDEEAATLVHGYFGISFHVARLATEKDDTFRVDAAEGRRYVVKISNPFEDTSEIDLQCALMKHVAAVDPSLPVPRLVPTRSGDVHIAINDSAGQRRRIRMMTYLEGTPLDHTGSSPSERERVGEILGRLRLATADFSHAADRRTLAWDVQHLLGLGHLLDGVADAYQRRQLAAALDRFAGIQDRIAPLRRQVLHNDFSKSNIIVDHRCPEFVTGIIDFGDVVHTAVAIDVATALLNQLPRDIPTAPDTDLFADARDLLRGYLRVADLTQEELALIPHLTMGRVVVRALLTLWRARLFPRNSVYILRNTAQGWAQLEWFLARCPAVVSATLLSDNQPYTS